MTLLEAIAAFEGFGVNPLNRPTRNNNPGNLSFGPFAQSHGAVIEEIPKGYSSTPRFARFETVDHGWKALRHLLETRYKGHTVREMVMKYAPPFENDTEFYIKFICERVGCKPNTVIDDLLTNPKPEEL